MKKLLKVLLYIVASIGSTILGGIVLKTLWSWFIAAKFGLPLLGTAEAIGVALVVSYMTKQITDFHRDDEARFNFAVLAYLKPLVCLLIGYIVLQFI